MFVPLLRPQALIVGLLLCLMIGAPSVNARDYELPNLGQPADTYMSPAEENRIGRQVVGRLLDAGMILEDLQLREYLATVGARLATSSDADASAFRFYPIDSAQVNAFALPGGYIGINAGLMTETATESELAGVMAHEMAHVTQRHIARQMQATSGMGWATMAAILAAAIAAGGDGEAISAAATAGMANLGQQQINFTRAHEFEADRLGIRSLAESGFDPDGMANFFETMQRRASLYGTQLPQILLSHPVSNTRMAEAETRARDYTDRDIRESPAYPLMKERARVLTTPQLSELARRYAQRRQGSRSPALDYGYALTLIRLGRREEAIEILEPLVAAQPNQPAFVLALADAQSKAGHGGLARERLEDARERFPDSRAVKLAYAELLADSGEGAAMRQFLIADGSGLLSESAEAQQLLAQYAGAENKLGEAYYRQAKYHELRGAYAPAINQLRTALQIADLDGFDKARLRALLDQMIAACQSTWSERECREQVRADTRY